ncbi:hypothetical protein [Novosphingobium sp.]|uniref:hypothetical protein n=1 Tax=Novosphingobium sp. TaxID=1874826 RepID=UPI003567482D
MTQEAYLGGAWRTIETGEIYLFGAWRRLTYAEAYLDGEWETIATYTSPVSVTISPASTNGSGAFNGPISVLTSPVTATPSGGLGPYTYAWTNIVNGGGTASSAISPTMATTAFIKPSVPAATGYSDTLRCTVTDSLGRTGSADILAEFLNVGGIE